MEKIVKQFINTRLWALVAACAVLGPMSVRAASPFRSVSGGRLLHVPSKLSFPAKVALFSRSRTHLYDSTGRDASVRYIVPGFILADVYVYPVGPQRPDLNTEFKIQQNAIQTQNKKVKLVSQTNLALDQADRSVRGKWANYELVRGLFGGETNRKCGSQLFVFRDGPWFVAYRFSYPRERSDIANKHVTDFVHQWQWRVR